MLTIRIAAALILGPNGKALLVRKRGSSIFMQPGGKIEPGEAPLTALLRELEEELALHLHLEQPQYLGCYEAEAANEPGHRVVAELFGLHIAHAVTPQAEIEEIAWIDPTAPGRLPIAPLSRQHILKQSPPVWPRLPALLEKPHEIPGRLAVAPTAHHRAGANRRQPADHDRRQGRAVSPG